MLLRVLAFIAFLAAALLAFQVITISGGLGVALAWVAVGLMLWVADTFAGDYLGRLRR